MRKGRADCFALASYLSSVRVARVGSGVFHPCTCVSSPRTRWTRQAYVGKRPCAKTTWVSNQMVLCETPRGADAFKRHPVTVDVEGVFTPALVATPLLPCMLPSCAKSVCASVSVALCSVVLKSASGDPREVVSFRLVLRALSDMR